MKIKLNGLHVIRDWYIASDDMNYILFRKTTTQKGNNPGREFETNRSYHNSLANAGTYLINLLHHQLLQTEIDNLTDFVNECRILTKEIHAAMEDVAQKFKD